MHTRRHAAHRRRHTQRAVLVLCLFLLLPGCRRDPDAAPPPETDVAVLVHSYSGTTATVGRAIAAMLQARFTQYTEPPAEAGSQPANPQPFADLDVEAALGKARHVYLGFPIWAASPPAQTFSLVERLDWHGRRVTLLYTYLHHVDPVRIAMLRERIAAGGGTLTSDVALRFSLTATDAAKRAAAVRAILADPTLWQEKERPAMACRPAVPPLSFAMCAVPAGTVWLGDPVAGRTPERRRVGAFALARTEVTQRDYAACVAAAGCPAIDLRDSSCSILAIGDELPMPCVTFEQARQFCTWAGLRLPSETEWTRAARGGGIDPYPWGEQSPGQSTAPLGNFGERQGEGIARYELVPPDSTWPRDGHAGLAPGCSFPAGNSPFGVCDLAGNLFEWVESSNTQPSDDDRAVLKGGSWMDADDEVFRVGARGAFYRNHSFYLVGFRCADDLDGAPAAAAIGGAADGD